MAQEHSQNEVKQSKWPLYVSAALILSLVVSYFLVPPVKEFAREAYNVLTSDDDRRISDWVNQLGIWGPVFIISAMVFQMFLLVVPSPLLMVVAVLAYGPFVGSLISIAAVFLASTVGYWVGRSLGVITVYKLIGSKKEKKIQFYVERYGWWAVVISRLAPILSNDAISFIGGLLRMNYWKFIGATLLGITPLAALIGYFGENNERLKLGLIWTAVVSLLLLVFYIIFDQRKRKRSQYSESS